MVTVFHLCIVTIKSSTLVTIGDVVSISFPGADTIGSLHH